MSVLNRPQIEAYIGASGSGKGVSVSRRLAELKSPRLLVWDPRDEYGKAAPQMPSLPHLVGAFKHAKGGPVRARYVAGGAMPLAEAFGFVCQLAFEAGNLVLVAEELSDVTDASRAPPAWRQVITQGRHKGLHVIGCAQRPALIDKTFLGNATYIRCFTLRYAEDRRAMARAMDVPEADITALDTSEAGSTTTIRYLERDFRSKVLQPGQIKLTRRGRAT
jgi:hypothetical protein